MQDFANPLVRPHMNFLPHDDGKRMSQAWHGHKMIHDIPDRFLTPCVRLNGRVFYVNELVRRQNDWFIPLRWITAGSNNELCAIGYKVQETSVSVKVIGIQTLEVPTLKYHRLALTYMMESERQSKLQRFWSRFQSYKRVKQFRYSMVCLRYILFNLSLMFLLGF